MIYEKQIFIDYPNEGYTTLKAEHLNHIEDGIATVYDDLYDTKTNDEWTLKGATTANLLNPGYTNEYPSSTFSGWCGCIGNPQGFNKIRFPVKPRTDYPITAITVKILEIPDVSTVVFGTSTSAPYTPKPAEWTVVAEKTVSFGEDNALTVGSYNLVECEFNEVIENSEGKYYYLAILCNNRVTMGFFETTYNDIEFNPWMWYATNGASTPHTGLGVGTYDSTSKSVYTLACEFYYKSSSTTYIEIGTTKKDKFFGLVNECLNNSESFGEIFQEAYKYKHQCGSINLSSTTATSFQNTTSTFSGVVFPIGVIPEDIESSGVLLQIKTRSNNGSTKPISQVNAFLYSVENVPLTETYKGEAFHTLNPTLLRTGVAKCNFAVDEGGVVYVEWTEGTFINKEGKFLMLGYECDSYNYRCCTSKTGASVCGSIDGNSYGSLETWYSTSQSGEQAWRPRWQDTNANAWSFVTSEKYYDLGEKFYALLDEALDNRLGDISFDVNIAPTSEIRLAKSYDLVVGDKFQLYYEGVIKGFDVLNEGILVNCAVGKQYPRYWEFEPTDENVGQTYTLTLKTRQLDGSVISTGSTKINVHAKLTNDTTPANLTALIFGDSLTSSGAWAAEGFRRIYGATDSGASGPVSVGVTNTLTTYGSKRNTTNTFAVSHEGYGGWTWNSFLTAERGSDSTTNGIVVTLSAAHGYDLDAVQKSVWTDNNGKLWELEDFPSETQIKFNRGNGNNATQANTASPTSMTCDSPVLSITPTSVVWESTNPFYDEATQSLDFNAHAAKYGAGDADIVACLLTWNGASGISASFSNDSIISGHMSKASQLIKAIHEDFPNAKIICMGIQLSSITGGSGYNYGAKGGYADTWGSAFYAFDYDKALEELVTEDPELAEYCYYVDTKGQFDTYYCMPYSDVAVNTRVSNITEMRGKNGVHPSTAGYYQIGDAFYRALTKVIPIVKAEKSE
jgi:hypothetical protein